MRQQVVVGPERDVARWRADRCLGPREVIRVSAPRSEMLLRGVRWADGAQVTQLEPAESRAVTDELHKLMRRYRPEPPPGLFVAFEGGEGAGKSTQLKRLADLLWRAGRDVVVTREPGGTRLGHTIRRVLLDQAYPDPPAARTEALLFATDRAHHVESVIRPWLARGAVVLTDRYVDSSLAYQAAGRDLDEEQVRTLSEFATGGLVPDLTVLLDVPPAVGLRRVGARGDGNRLDAEGWQFHERVRDRFLELVAAQPRRYVVIDGQLPDFRVGDHVAAAVEQLLDERLPVFEPMPHELR